MVHSINPNDHYMNIYAPDIIINRLRKVYRQIQIRLMIIN